MTYKAYSNIESKGSADRVADRIADSIIDKYIFKDHDAMIKCQAILAPGYVTVYIEGYTSEYDVNIDQTVRAVLTSVNSPNFSDIDPDSYSINIIRKTRYPLRSTWDSTIDRGASCSCTVEGYASSETEEMVPLHEKMAYLILDTMDRIREEGKLMKYLGHERKCQVGVTYDSDNGHPVIDSIHVNTQARFEYSNYNTDEEDIKAKLKNDLIFIVKDRVLSEHPELKEYISPNIQYNIDRCSCYSINGVFQTIGVSGKNLGSGFRYCGLTHNDTRRSASLAARNVAKNMVAAGVADKVQVELTYMQGVAAPVGIEVNTMGTNRTNMTEESLAKMVDAIFDLRHQANIARLRMENPVYSEYAEHGLDGFNSKPVRKTIFHNIMEYDPEIAEILLFPWEVCDKIDMIKDYIKNTEKGNNLTQE